MLCAMLVYIERGFMWQVLHGSAKTTEAMRRAIQDNHASIASLVSKYDLNPKTVHKWKKRSHDAAMEPKRPHSTVLMKEEEVAIVALFPLDDCLYALQSTIPHLTQDHRYTAVCNVMVSVGYHSWMARRSKRRNLRNTPPHWICSCGIVLEENQDDLSSIPAQFYCCIAL